MNDDNYQVVIDAEYSVINREEQTRKRKPTEVVVQYEPVKQDDSKEEKHNYILLLVCLGILALPIIGVFAAIFMGLI